MGDDNLNKFIFELNQKYNQELNFKTVYDKLSIRLEIYTCSKENLKSILTQFGYSAAVIAGPKIGTIMAADKQSITCGVDNGWVWTYIFLLLKSTNGTVNFAHFNHTYYGQKEKNCLVAMANDRKVMNELAAIMSEFSKSLGCITTENIFKKYQNPGISIPPVEIENDIIFICMLYKICNITK